MSECKVKAITLDNGLEFAHHEKIAEGSEADIYFAHPYASWERGINENTNGLIRQYFPKGADFNEVSDKKIEGFMYRLNHRPRASRFTRCVIKLQLLLEIGKSKNRKLANINHVDLVSLSLN